MEKTKAWKWDYLDRRWSPVKANSIYPGLVIVVPTDAGGYDPCRGFDASLKGTVPCFTASQSTSDADAAEEDESLSVTSRWETIAEHGAKAANELHHIFGNNDNPVLDMAACWHDFGKAHPAFQSLLVDALSSDIAKAPPNAWRRPPKYAASEIDPRPGFRHELASALAIIDLLRQVAPDHAALRGPWKSFFPESAPVERQDFCPTPAHQRLAALSVNELNLLLYLVAAHHGKVRVALHASPADQLHPVAKTGGEMPIRGVLEGDTIPPTTLRCPTGNVEVPLATLSLAPAAIGLSEAIGASWGERCSALLAEHGPFQLAYLETLLRAADIRASRK
ncbi:MAG TPA: HD domain-containing protein [Kiritimatiellia bacterium]|nr:HD domain-containing protein [Kiritimatiellia bacterium]HRU71123.1 HD domain-containing protein [Kiritimatiellia bacterium]